MPEDRIINVIVTGATGMVGEGVLHECLLSDAVGQVLSVSRKPGGVSHPKLREVVHSDFTDLPAIKEQLSGYDACLFCLGVSSVGKQEAEFYKLTYELTMHFAKTVSELNPDMVFCYISGAGTDSSEKGGMMWARVKGKTENDLMKLPFKKAYNFRPGGLEPTKGLKNTLPYYKWLGWLLPVIRVIAPNRVSTLKELGQAMIRAAAAGYPNQIIEVTDIHILAGKTS